MYNPTNNAFVITELEADITPFALPKTLRDEWWKTHNKQDIQKFFNEAYPNFQKHINDLRSCKTHISESQQKDMMLSLEALIFAHNILCETKEK